ncbi:MAG: hypothetical protein QY312_00665 [Candidatus Dojkabacteria bacterium]|nr:MAG: hypothetical protein QY312_00665 [Candidatus Dojkabacteria bacterium]
MPIVTTGGQAPTKPAQQVTQAASPSRIQSTMTATPPMKQQVNATATDDSIVATEASGVTPQRQQQPSVPTSPASAVPTFDDFSDDFDDDLDLDDENFEMKPRAQKSSVPGVSLSRMTEEERRKVITTVFELVLGRAPADRDFSYYRFSTLTEEGLIRSLLNLPDHKKLVEKANEHTSLKQSVSDLDLQVKQLDTSMQSMRQELLTMQELLVEKNRYIQQMRAVPESGLSHQPSFATPSPSQTSMSIPPESPQMAQNRTDAGQSEKPPQVIPEIETKTLPGPMDEIKNMFQGLFRRK